MASRPWDSSALSKIELIWTECFQGRSSFTKDCGEDWKAAVKSGLWSVHVVRSPFCFFIAPSLQPLPLHSNQPGFSMMNRVPLASSIAIHGASSHSTCHTTFIFSIGCKRKQKQTCMENYPCLTRTRLTAHGACQGKINDVNRCLLIYTEHIYSWCLYM
jgi:hypothetical protein